MGLDFEVLKTSADGGRRGRLHLPHRTVETPVFMPVGTAGTVKAVAQDVLETLGAEIILGNTYVQLGAGQRDPDFVIMPVRIFALALVIAQVMARGKSIVNSNFEHSFLSDQSSF